MINFQLNIGQYLQYHVCACSALSARSANKHTVIEIAKFSFPLKKFKRSKHFLDDSLITSACCMDILMRWEL